MGDTCTILVDGVKVDSTTSYTFTNVTSDHTIEAFFSINTYTITPTAGPNGIIIPPSPVLVNHGSSQLFSISPDVGYHIDSVLVDSVKVDSTTSYTFTNVTADHTIEAFFSINAYTITATAGGSGSITPSGVVGINHGGSQANLVPVVVAHKGLMLPAYWVADTILESGQLLVPYEVSGGTQSYTRANGPLVEMGPYDHLK